MSEGEEKPAPPRCINCPLYEAGRKLPIVGACHRYPKAETVHRADLHWCAEHPRAAEIVGNAAQ